MPAALFGQPGDAERNTIITTVDYVPSGVDPVSVEVLDASGSARIGGSTPLLYPIRLSLADNPWDASLTGVTTRPANIGGPIFRLRSRHCAEARCERPAYCLKAKIDTLASEAIRSSFAIVDEQQFERREPSRSVSAGGAPALLTRSTKSARAPSSPARTCRLTTFRFLQCYVARALR